MKQLPNIPDEIWLMISDQIVDHRLAGIEFSMTGTGTISGSVIDFRQYVTDYPIARRILGYTPRWPVTFPDFFKFVAMAWFKRLNFVYRSSKEQ